MYFTGQFQQKNAPIFKGQFDSGIMHFKLHDLKSDTWGSFANDPFKPAGCTGYAVILKPRFNQIKPDLRIGWRKNCVHNAGPQ